MCVFLFIDNNFGTDGVLDIRELTINMLCFRYNYHVPFLKVNGILTIQEKCIGPLYKHVFPPRLAPRLSFVGIPNKVTFTSIQIYFIWLHLCN